MLPSADLPSASPDGRLEFDVLEHDIEALVQVDPLEARERLARYLDPVVLTPVEEDGRVEYDYDITLRYDSATLAGGRVIDKNGCGGTTDRPPSTRNAVLSLRVRRRARAA